MNIERCKHGLCRNCHLCYYENQIERLTAENENLKRQLAGVSPQASESTE